MRILLILFLTSALLTTVQAQSYLDEISRARQIDFEKNGVKIKQIELGAIALGKNNYSIEVTNERANLTSFTLQCIAKAGLSQGEDDQVLEFKLKPGEKKRLEGEYSFSSLSPFAKIFIGVWEGSIKGDPLFRERFHIGVKNPALSYDLSKFGNVSGHHLNLYFLPDTLAERNALQILDEREAGLAKIEKLIETKFDETITLFLYPNMDSKAADTLHTGEGWAFDQIMVEVYNKETQLDPFHEMTHIIAAKLGSPPPLFDEGFAVYVSESLGSDALEYIVGPNQKIDDVMKKHKHDGKLVSLADLLNLKNIGDTAERSEIEYPEAASFVKYLIKNFGSETFRKIFSTLKADGDSNENRKQLENITGKPLAEIEAHWLKEI